MVNRNTTAVLEEAEACLVDSLEAYEGSEATVLQLQRLRNPHPHVLYREAA